MKKKKDKLHSIGDDYEQIIVTLTEEDHFIPTRKNIEEVLPEEYFTLFVECSECGHIHNIKKPCACGKITDVYVD